MGWPFESDNLFWRLRTFFYWYLMLFPHWMKRSKIILVFSSLLLSSGRLANTGWREDHWCVYIGDQPWTIICSISRWLERFLKLFVLSFFILKCTLARGVCIETAKLLHKANPPALLIRQSASRPRPFNAKMG